MWSTVWKRRVLPALAIAALTATAAIVTGCGTPSTPDSPPSIRGVVTSVEPSADGGSLRVVWTQDSAIGEQAEYDAAQVAVTPETEVLARAGSGPDFTYENIEFEQLKNGDVVEAWFEGPVAESYPVQAGADVLVVTGAYAGELPTPPGLEPEPAP